MSAENKEASDILNIARYKLNLSMKLYKESLYIQALESAYAGLKILQANDLTEDQCATDLVNLIGYICFEMPNDSQDPLAVMLENLSIMRSSFPDITASNDNIISLQFNIAVEYTKLGDSNLDEMILYASESMRLLRKTRPDLDHQYYQKILEFINNICEYINTKHTIALFDKEDFKGMNLLAKIVYDLAKEFLVDSKDITKYAINLGISYNKIGMYSESLRYLREAQNIAKDLNELEIDLVNRYIMEGQEQEDYNSIISDATYLYDLSKIHLARGDYKKAIDDVVNAANLFLSADTDMKEADLDLSVQIKEVCSYVEEKILQHYENNELTEGIEVANIAKDAFNQFDDKDDSYALSFFALAVKGYYKSGNCEEAINYFPEIIQEVKVSNIEGFDVVQKWIKDCDELEKKEVALTEFSKACELIGNLTLVECYSYLGGLVSDDA